MTRVLICCGSGGVGKTTTSAALALRQATLGLRVVVLTIDPARRLADALGVGITGEGPQTVDVPGLPPRGRLDALMLDTKRTFDEVIARFAPNAEALERIRRNHVYQQVSTRLAGVHEYMAMEKLFELAGSGSWDVVVVDTPPAAHALDFLRAPERMTNLMDEGVMRWLVLPASRGGWRMIERGSELLATILERFLGERTIGDIAEFFAAFQALWDGFRERSSQVRDLLRAPDTRFLLVATPSPAARREAIDFVARLREGSMPFGGFLINRCVEAPRFAGPGNFGPPPPGHEVEWAGLVAALNVLPARRRAQVLAQEASIAELAARAPPGAPVWRIPDLAADVADVRGLLQLAPHLPDAREV